MCGFSAMILYGEKSKFLNASLKQRQGHKLSLIRQKAFKKNTKHRIDPNHVRIRKSKTALQSVEFSDKNGVFGEMQIKFNNGILEKPLGGKFDFKVNGKRMKIGDPFGSWNFSL